MDWQIRIALVIVGIALVGYIIYDANQRKKKAIAKQRLIDQMRASAEQTDSLGFDVTGVGHVRKASDLITDPPTPEQSVNQPQPTRFSSASSDTGAEAVSEASSKSRLEQTEAACAPIDADLPNEPCLVLSLILRANDGEIYRGYDFLPLMLSQGLRHGEMGIFHRAESGNSGVLYSVANAIKPGTFDIANIQNFETPGFAFFMTVPGPKDPMTSFKGMVNTIKMMKQELGGQILDESKSVFTEQTYQHQCDRLTQFLTKQSLRPQDTV